MTETAVLLCGHGSRDPEAIREFEAAAAALRPRLARFDFAVGYLEFARPTIRDALAQLAARGARRIAESTWALSVTGIAGPDGGTPEKPVGTVFVGIAGPGGTEVKAHRFHGDREWIRSASAYAALDWLRLRTRGTPS